MRIIAVVTAISFAAGALALGQGTSFASPISATRMEMGSPLIQVQQKKEETTTEKVKRNVKRTWRNLTGYKFNVSCIFSQTTCTETGKSKGDAQAKCQAAHPLCSVTEAK
jgi:hypothetical protein